MQELLQMLHLIWPDHLPQISTEFFRLALCFMVFMGIQKAHATGAGITYHGRLIDPNGSPVVSSNVQFRIQIRTPSNENCLMCMTKFKTKICL